MALVLGAGLLAGVAWAGDGAGDGPPVRGGMLDLRAGLPDGALLALDGEWLAAWGRLAGAESGACFPDPAGGCPAGDWTAAHLPGIWNGQPLPGGGVMGSQGAATYRLRILLPADGAVHTLQVPLVKSASRVWLNGEPVAAAGVPAPSAAGEVAQTATRFVTLPAGLRVADIAIELSNHFHHEGGIGASLLLARGDGLRHDWTVRLLVSSGVALSLLLLAAYLTAFARCGERSTYYLMSGLLTASAVRMLCTSELLTTLFPRVDAALAYRLEYLPIYLFWPIYFHALDHLLPGCLHRRVGQGMDLLGGAGALFVLLAEPAVFTRFRDVASLLLGLSILYFVLRIVAAARRRHHGAVLLGLGAMLFMLAVVHDAMMYAHLFDGIDLVPFGVLGFLFMHALILGRRVMRAFDEVRNLSAELTCLNEGLERQVQDRTRELRRQSAIVESVLRQAKERAEADAALKSRFLAHLSHEVRTPLNAVLGMVRLMQRSPAAADAERLRVIDGAGRHLVGLLDEVLELSRLEANRLTLNPEPSDAAGLVHDAVALFRPAAAEKGLDIAVTITGAVAPWYRLDRRRLHQILLNLLSNAVKFTRQGGVLVTLDAVPAPVPGREERLLLSVADSGPGVPDSEKKAIFNAFTRVEGVDRLHGSGLGLAIVRGLAVAMGGSVQVSDRPGGGALFTLALPVHLALPPPKSMVGGMVNGVVGAAPAPSALDILVVEDAEENRAVLRAFLAPAGHRLVEVESGEAALRLLEDRRFDVILMDIRLPGMSGVEASRRIRALPDEAAALTPIIAVTANASSGDEVEYRAAGIDDILPKPLDPDHLAAVLARHTPARNAGGAAVPRLAESIAPDRLARLLGLFAATCREQRAALAEADSPARVASIAHRLKGSAGTYGYPALSAAAAALEAAAGRGGPPPAALLRAVDAELEAALASLEVRSRTPAGG